MQQDDPGAKAVASLLKRLNVAPDGQDAFVGAASQSGGPRLFGGMVAGQAVVAAARTVEGPQIHSLHAYFLQPGDPTLDVSYRVERLKEGKNFQARQVIARQAGRVIFSMQASFQRVEPGFSHQDQMPAAPDPDTLPERGWGFWGTGSPVRMRDSDGGDFDESAKNGMRRVWMKPAAALPEDPILHLGLMTFATDMTLVMTGILPHPELRQRPRGGASLDHAVWFHRPPLFDDWLLYVMTTPAANAGRPLMQAAMYRRDGTRVASVAQEGLIRFRRA